MHNQDIIHCDLFTDNIFIDELSNGFRIIKISNFAILLDKEDLKSYDFELAN